MPGKGPKKVKYTSKDVPERWRNAVKSRALSEEVDEDDVIRFGLHHDFKAKKREEESIAVLKDIRDELKKGKD